MKLAAALAVLALSAGAAEIPRGTHVLLRMLNSINTRTATEGNQVYLQTVTPVAIDGAMVIPPGTYVQGSVSHAQRSGRIKGHAQLGIRLETMTFTGGKIVKISPRLSAVDSGETGQKVDDTESQIKQAPTRGKDTEQVAIPAPGPRSEPWRTAPSRAPELARAWAPPWDSQRYCSRAAAKSIYIRERRWT
jgi:hypothetical protein